jgi:iron complex outermembrane receptor protein
MTSFHACRRSRRIAAPVALLALGAGQPSAAQEARPPAAQASPAPQREAEKPKGLPIVVEKVTVSATVAEESRDPASVTTLDATAIARGNRGQDLSMLLADTPNAYAYSDAGNGVGYGYLSLRGFDQRRIAVYVNGVPLNDPESLQVYFIDLADLASGLDSIQVQRGTGTALYGSPAVGGVVNLETGALPTEPRGDLALGAGSFGTLRGSLRYSLPLGDGHSALSLRAAHVRSDGYRQPAWTRHSLGELGYQRVGNDSVFRVRLLGGPEKTQLAYYGVPAAYLRGEVSGDAERDRRVNPLAAGEIDSFLQPQIQLLHDLRLRPGLLLKNTAYSILGDGYFRQWSDAYLYDPLGIDGSGVPQASLAAVWRRREVTKRQYGWLPSASIEHARGRLVLGGELRASSTHHEGRITDAARCAQEGADGGCQSVGAPLSAELPLYDYRTRKTTLSAHAREQLSLTSRLRLSLELQARHHALAMSDDQVRGYSWEAGYGFLTPSVGLSFDASERLNLYASASASRSEPRFDDIWNPQDTWADPHDSFATSDAAGRHFEDALALPERLRAFEGGAGYRSADLRLMASAYWMDFRDELVYAGGINDDGLPITDNAARSLHRGIEIEGWLRLPAGFELSGSLAASDDVLKEYVLHFGPAPEDRVDYSGNRIALFPTHQGRLRLSKAFGRARLAMGVRRVGTLYLDNSENERKDPALRAEPGYEDKQLDPFTLADLQAAVELGHGRRRAALSLGIENVFDRRYAASGYVYGEPYFFPAAGRAFYLGVSVGF